MAKNKISIGIDFPINSRPLALKKSNDRCVENKINDQYRRCLSLIIGFPEIHFPLEKLLRSL